MSPARAEPLSARSYFDALNLELRAHGQGRPTIVLDMDRVLRNCARLRASLKPSAAFRVVAKSLPCVSLLSAVMDTLETDRLMVFHAPHLVALAQAFPHADFSFGKPMPVAAAAACQRKLPAAFDAQSKVQWLIDSRERLLQYQQLARSLDQKFRISLEIDLGLHRGGFAEPAALVPALELIASDARHLELAGFMGYDAHVGKLPAWLERRDVSLARANARYREFVELVRTRFPGLFSHNLVLNGAGSPTFRLHHQGSPLNELSAGSCLVLPADFELPLLSDLEPAAFIATPVLKLLPGVQVPGLERLGRLTSALARRQTLFIYGGGWRARPVWPDGLADDRIFGFSANQACLHAPKNAHLAVDDYVFLQPLQSEGTLAALGDLAVLRAGKLSEYWAPLTA